MDKQKENGSKKNSVTEFMALIDNRVQQLITAASERFSKLRKGTVISYDDETYTALIQFDEDKEGSTYEFVNKTGENLFEGDRVGVTYYTSAARGILSIRYGDPSPLSNYTGVLEPITAITINSDTDYMVSTNAGIEKYIAVFEDD
ncbi:MAG: hypothetical protein IJZ47_07975 [Oscillospiraceae bacterium]|nr:hypothetical protein [Oscillospiraceae bacterium]